MIATIIAKNVSSSVAAPFDADDVGHRAGGR